MPYRRLLLMVALAALAAFSVACGGPGGSVNVPEQPRNQEPRPGRAGETAPAEEEPAGEIPARKVSAEKVSAEKPVANEPEARKLQARKPAARAPRDFTLKITIPKMGRIKDDSIPYTVGDDEAALKEHAAIHLKGTGHPWNEEANVFIAGHRLGYPATDSWFAFWDLDELERGDDIIVTDANGTRYTYEVFKTFEVAPTDVYVTRPVRGKNVVTLQTCTLPDYSKRLIVQAERRS